MSSAVANPSPEANVKATSQVAASQLDTGLTCLLILARFFGVPANGDQLRHQFSESGKVLSDTDLCALPGTSG
jgi:subfamily B ATP-binding cassette protein HlyB/CyaB